MLFASKIPFAMANKWVFFAVLRTTYQIKRGNRHFGKRKIFATGKMIPFIDFPAFQHKNEVSQLYRDAVAEKEKGSILNDKRSDQQKERKVMCDFEATGEFFCLHKFGLVTKNS